MYPKRFDILSYNTRELGGYPCEKGYMTSYKKFLRSDDISRLNTESISVLLNYGVKTVIDLRGEDEIKSDSVFCNRDGVKYFNIPLLGKESFSILEDKALTGFEAFYISILNNKEMMKSLFKTICENDEGVTIFHCSAGKDRTGITACLLLMLAGVPLSDIAADYQVTYSYISPIRAIFQKTYPDTPLYHMRSDPEWIEHVYYNIVNERGGVVEYLKSLGILESQIIDLKKRLVVPIA